MRNFTEKTGRTLWTLWKGHKRIQFINYSFIAAVADAAVDASKFGPSRKTAQSAIKT